MRFVLFDRWGTQTGEPLDVLAASRQQSVEGTDVLTLTVVAEVGKGDRIVFEDPVQGWREFEVTATDTQRTTTQAISTVTAKDAINELSGAFIEDVRNRNASVTACLQKALQGTRWTVGTVETPSTPTATLAFYHTNALQAVEDVANAFGLEVETSYTLTTDGASVAARRVNLRQRRGRATTGKRFTYGKDLTSIRRTISADNVVTRMYGYGKGIATTDEDDELTGGYSRKISFADINGGKAYVEDTTATSLWGLPDGKGGKRSVDGIYENGDQEDPAALLAETRAALQAASTPTISYEADVVALGRAGFDAEGVGLGDSIQIIDTTFPEPLRLEGRVLEIQEDLLGSLEDTKLTLGNITQTLTNRNDRVEQALGQLTGSAGAWDSAAGLGQNYLNGVIDGLNQVMNATGGYTYIKPGEGLFVYDRPEDQNPTMCIQLGGGYFRIADGKNASGEWNFRTLGNGHGLVADALYTGTIQGGANSWNLNTGELLFRQGAITINGPSNTRTVIDSTNGLKIYQGNTFIGGLEIVGNQAYLRAARAGTQSNLYVTTGQTQQGHPGASFVNSYGSFIDIEAMRALDDPTDATTGVGMSCFNKPFLHANYWYRQIYVHPPTVEETYLEPPDERLYMRSNYNALNNSAAVILQMTDTRGLFMDNQGITLKWDNTHYITVNSNGVQARCGSRGFGWVNGQFSNNLVWN